MINASAVKTTEASISIILIFSIAQLPDYPNYPITYLLDAAPLIAGAVPCFGNMGK